MLVYKLLVAYLILTMSQASETVTLIIEPTTIIVASDVPPLLHRTTAQHPNKTAVILAAVLFNRRLVHNIADFLNLGYILCGIS